MATPTQAQKRGKKIVIREASDAAFSRKPVKAIKLIDEYLSRTDQNDVDLLLLKAHILDMNFKFDDATRLYRQILMIDRSNPQAHIDLGDHYSCSKHDYRKALQHYDRALQSIEAGRSYLDKEDEFIEACIGKAEALTKLNRRTDALKCIVHGLQKYPEDTLLTDALQRAQESRREAKARGSRERQRSRERGRRGMKGK